MDDDNDIELLPRQTNSTEIGSAAMLEIVKVILEGENSVQAWDGFVEK